MMVKLRAKILKIKNLRRIKEEIMKIINIYKWVMSELSIIIKPILIIQVVVWPTWFLIGKPN